MIDIIITGAHTFWHSLPQITIGLQFTTALIGFGAATTATLVRIRRWTRRRHQQR